MTSPSASKSACIIGASRGLGLGLARRLAEKGYTVFATQRSHSAELADAAAASDGAIKVHEMDVTDAASIAALAQAIPAGSLDILVLNAGVYGGGEQDLADLTRDNVADILMTNAVCPARAAVGLLPSMKDGGTIGMMSSKMGSIDDSSGGSNLYRLSKVGQNMLSRSLFEKHARPRGIGVISLHPGWVQTDMGGPNALIDVDTSVSGMIDVLEAEREPRHAFLAYDGQAVPW
ncbi:SDR family NAD(P)-dependent oxidoreductase [Alteraurantiacibacter aquimixticola]|uniref:SDR family NAD(P)-dependent oxidoreductase n=1 Tax=Alteraurantiacibacter aquimixticola TaxID=2489173 RepID=A0A4T3F0H6_9SPHN|nr:SDR family NAD(P)-dependent oxidoreductase [Alteraurantiacibacter aquimixticola]TIX49417.1 SDR family NAD(P)-dependent oxidoreductase [Alteraurantiacibacter aquimixticola]